MTKPRRRLTVAGSGRISLDGQVVTYVVKRSTRAKLVRFEIRQGTGLTVVIPKAFEMGQVSGLLEAKASWILGKLARCHVLGRLAAKSELKSGDRILYLGRDLVVLRAQGDGNPAGANLEHNTLHVGLRSASDSLNTVVERWYRTQAARLIKGKAALYGALMGVTYDLLVIRGQKTRWGSCSRKGNLSFNWKLVMAPEPVLDYVVIHELAHLKEMNHTKKFWRLIDEHCPQWHQQRRWLKEHEAELAAILPI
jgi:predicted metal-dependent hydrolase